MRTIEIDDEVYSYIQSNALAYVEKVPNETLRRLFGLDCDDNHSLRPSKAQRKGRKRKRRTNLSELVQAGYVKEGQKLCLYNYHGDKVKGGEATISEERALFYQRDGNIYTMSKLAVKLFKEQGYQSNTACGPRFWFTEDGVSIAALWKQYLNKQQG